MKNVRWSDNVCTVGGTCVHGYFTGDELKYLTTLCDGLSFTATFYHEHLMSFSNPDDLKKIVVYKKVAYNDELSYYVNFMETQGQKLLDYLNIKFPMNRGESC